MDDELKTVWRDDPRAADLTAWMIRAGITGHPHDSFLEDYCQQLLSLGVPLMRAHFTTTALHPVYGGIGFDWIIGEGPINHRYAHTDEAPDSWTNSPFFHMISSRQLSYRERIIDSDAPSRFALLNEMRALGATDYLAMGILFDDPNPDPSTVLTDDRDGALMSWMANGENGFSDADLRLIKVTFPTLCLGLRSSVNRTNAEDLLGVYLGRDAGRRVFSGEIRRGSSRWIDAVICYFDLEGFTSMSRRIEGEALIAMLNDYFGVVVHHIEDHGGNVLKFMGDGMLAIFDRDALSDAPERALRATAAIEDDMARRSAQRTQAGLETLGSTMALHAGSVLYGNIGADARLDFTVIGPEVNLAARLSGMHRPLGQSVILSETLVRDVTDPGFDLISLGRYMLRGVDQPQELFTLYRT